MTLPNYFLHQRINARPSLATMRNTEPGGWFRAMHASLEIINGVSNAIARAQR
jgi:hypothetical protein